MGDGVDCSAPIPGSSQSRPVDVFGSLGSGRTLRAQLPDLAMSRPLILSPFFDGLGSMAIAVDPLARHEAIKDAMSKTARR